MQSNMKLDGSTWLYDLQFYIICVYKLSIVKV